MNTPAVLVGGYVQSAEGKFRELWQAWSNEWLKSEFSSCTWSDKLSQNTSVICSSYSNSIIGVHEELALYGMTTEHLIFMKNPKCINES